MRIERTHEVRVLALQSFAKDALRPVVVVLRIQTQEVEARVVRHAVPVKEAQEKRDCEDRGEGAPLADGPPRQLSRVRRDARPTARHATAAAHRAELLRPAGSIATAGDSPGCLSPSVTSPTKAMGRSTK
jgi:hypothetical protein